MKYTNFTQLGHWAAVDIRWTKCWTGFSIETRNYKPEDEYPISILEINENQTTMTVVAGK